MRLRYFKGILVPVLFLCLAFGSPDKASAGENFGLKLVGQVGGATEAVAVRGNYAYVGVGLRLVVLNVSNPQQPVEVGFTEPFSSYVEDVAIQGKYAYVAAGGAGLRVVDISDPANPTEVGAWDSPGYAQGVVLSGSTAYLADGPCGLRLVDVSTPSQPKEVSHAYPLHYAFDVAVSGSFVYVAAGGAGLLVVDASRKSRPVELGAYDTPGYAYGVVVSGKKAYVADGWEGLRVVDVSNPASPKSTGACKTKGWALHVAVSANKAYVADGGSGLGVLDISNPAQPKQVGGYEMHGGLARRIAVGGNKAYVADKRGGIRILDVQDPQHCTQTAVYDPLLQVTQVAVSGSYAYVAAGYSGFHVVDISDPTHARRVASQPTPGGCAYCVVLSGNHAYVSTFWGDHYLYVFEISDPLHPTRLAITRIGGETREMAIEGQTLFMVDGGDLLTVDISNPEAPSLTGSIHMWGPNNDRATQDVAVSGSFAYVANDWGGLKILDVSNLEAPTVVGTCEAGNVMGVSVVGNLAYLASHTSGLRICDVSDPSTPFEVGHLDTPGTALRVTVSDSIAYVAADSGGVNMFDVSNPQAPTLLGYFDTAGLARDAALQGNRVYVADEYGGMVILERSDDGSSFAGEMPGQSVLTMGAENAAPMADAMKSGTAFPTRPRRYPTMPPPQKMNTVRSIENETDIGGVSADDLPEESWSVGADAEALCQVTSSGDSGLGTFRNCLENAVSGQSITFDPTVFDPKLPVAILLETQLPAITQGALTIDASNAGVILDGNHTPEGTVGLIIDSSKNVIKGLQILNFPGEGIQIAERASHNFIGGNRNAGTSPSGEGNVISKNGLWDGLRVTGSNNIVQGNLIGTDATGTKPMGNAGTGLCLNGPKNLVGGTTSGRGNVLSGNGANESVGGCGIQIVGKKAVRNRIIGNLIGTDITGTKALPNGAHGIQMYEGASYNTVGGPASGERNVVSGNQYSGFQIAAYSCDVQGVTGNRIIGNFIGTDISGTKALGNGGTGVEIVWLASGNVVGGDTPGERNIISGNEGFGVVLSDSGTSNNSVIGNFIGTDVTGNTAIGNKWHGVLIWNADFNRFGGTRKGEGNVISGNHRVGIDIMLEDSNLVLGNSIGTNPQGKQALGNQGPGVRISETTRHTMVGGATVAERNLISGNQTGIVIERGSMGYNVLAGNRIGTDVSGTMALGNNTGVLLWEYSHSNFVQGNLISGNQEPGVSVSWGSHSNVLRGNLIGTKTNGRSALANGTDGILITSPDNLIGGPYAGDNNTIAHNGNYGIMVLEYPGNTIRRNSIYSNAGMGIVLGDGGNDLLAAPVIKSVTGNSVAGKTCAGCTVEVFSDAEDEGRHYEGKTVAKASGWFTYSSAAPLQGPNVTATATDKGGNTSQFSGPWPVP